MFRAITMWFVFLAAIPVQARELTIATWNLGWHLSKSDVQTWIAKCGQPFALNSAGTMYEPSSAGTPGWGLDWDRDAPIPPLWDLSVLPPCNVFQDASRKVVPVTATAYSKRASQIATKIGQDLGADIIAFEEVSGEQAVRDVLPNGGADYNVCSFTDYKVQRLAFAWKKEFGDASVCRPEKPVSLPGESAKNQVRPGLTFELSIDGKLARFLAVHLKSSCVSPLDGTTDPKRGKLEGDEANCVILQEQVSPLEAWIEREAPADGRIVVLGDFNRSLWFEAQNSESVRIDGSDPTSALPSSTMVRNLVKEINDGSPANSKLTLLHETCPAVAQDKALCDDPTTVVDAARRKEARRVLPFTENLGCRNPMELDHILLGPAFTSSGGEKVSLGRMGRTLPASAEHPDPLLALSDHCPLKAVISD